MFSDILTEFTGKFDSRFITTVFFPCFIFLMIISGVAVYTYYPDPAVVFDIWKKYTIEVQAFIIIVFLCLAMSLALAMGSLITSILRFYEGYWDKTPLNRIGLGGKSIYELRKGYYRNRLCERWDIATDTQKDKSSSISAYNDIYLNYPPPTRLDEVMPTRLGNVLKGAEIYPHLRYNIDTVLVWPRLYPLLSTEFISSISSARAMMDMMLIVSVLGMGLTAFSFGWGLFLLVNPDLYRFSVLLALSILLLGGLLIFYLGYRLAIVYAARYGDTIKVAFDLYRIKVLNTLGYDGPQKFDDEFKLWGEVNGFLHRNFPINSNFHERKVKQ